MKHPDDKGWVERPTTPPSLPPAMDPHQMNDTPPCPNATPRTDAERLNWFRGHDAIIVVPADFARKLERELAQEREGHLSTQRTLVKLTKAQLSHSTQLAEAISPTAPLPTVAPHYAGLVERLENRRHHFHHMTDMHAMLTESIAALTQLAPLAGEVEHWKKRAFEAEQKQREMRERELAYAREGHNAVIETANYEHDLRAQIAASELDADALAGALEQISKDAPTWQADTFSAHAIIVCEQAPAHRARGAAGGKP